MASLLPILPEVLILFAAILLLVVDPFIKTKNNHRAFLGWFTSISLLIIMIVSLVFSQPKESGFIFGQMVRVDWLGFLFKNIFILAAGITALFFMQTSILNQRAEA